MMAIPSRMYEITSIDNMPTGSALLRIRRHEMPNKICVKRYWDDMEKSEQLAYVPERTAKMIDTGYATATCSECGVEFMGSIMTNESPDYVKSLERCPRCGARFEVSE